MKHSRWWLFLSNHPKAVVLGGLLCVGLLCWFNLSYWVISPPDRVPIRIINLPAGCRYASIVVEKSDQIYHLDWYPDSEVVIPVTMTPPECIWSSSGAIRNDQMSKPPLHVKWQRGSNYGVLLQDAQQKWYIIWQSEPPDPYSSWFRWGSPRSLVFDASHGQQVSVSDKLLQQLALASSPNAQQ
jgi:hypothetical protein